MRRSACTILVLLALLMAPFARSRAQDAPWPTRPIRIVMPFAAGGGTDITARFLAQRLTEKLGVSVVIENRIGGQGNIGALAVVRAAPDGYTLLYNTSFVVTSPALTPNIAYDWQRDLTPVVGVASVPLILLVHPSLPAQSLAEFAALVRRPNSDLSYASAGIGNTTHLAAARLLLELQGNATHVPYSGGAPALTDIVRGVVQFYMDTTNTAVPFVRNGTVRALGIASAQRVASLPDVPTIAEAIAPGFTAESWQGVMAPTGTPEAIIRRFSSEMLNLLTEPAVIERLAQSSTIPMAMPTAEYRAFLESEAEKWQAVIRAASIRLE
ncbi:tripartite tricarboxylate transporter substrate binding protein [Siccirubricoccus sp. KC 17139]|uniref:Tripartite tricarboxylate transporter substrate binding protein n=1 Tax=Siccirubricoccus soli TaxID=2899147 RepID=A0ABT1CZY7_9PROT|nr:tripartite tricarboxylate transporter substrate-binding protein [Siccirubricoccus soli]MCO6415218.1 tripartite tricarboxylate transporter substrate binding protein [Siccirubricoccus soli]MCP2681349.1 tripartite tricarboxylate transporter substrate-binding protein [Siccirubricoccus soli]